jgi:NTP pyrophosphatase (non-canonical NTP hydrolase)
MKIRPMTTAPFAIGSALWTGLSKLLEEGGEVIDAMADYAMYKTLGRLHQIGNKLVGTGGLIKHWDGRDLRRNLEDEIADLEATIKFFKRHNGLDEKRMARRTALKFKKFEYWQHKTEPHEALLDMNKPPKPTKKKSAKKKEAKK